MLVLFTDFGLQDPYVGQMKAALAQHAPGVPVIDLLHAVPDFNAHAGAHLLHALSGGLAPGSVVLGVVDPGVGGPREGVVLHADGRWFVGPDNGLFSVLAARAKHVEVWRIVWRPESLSASFHGRDLFAPIAAAIACGAVPHERLHALDALEVRYDAGELPRVIYIDHYGNAWTGVRGGLLDADAPLHVAGRALPGRRTFCEAEKGEAFWFVNSIGLIEIAANRASAVALLGLKVGDLVRLPGATGAAH